MQRKIFFTLFCLIFLFNQNLFSAPCYGPRLPEEKKFIVGLQSHIVFKRYLEDSFGKIRSLQNFILLSWGLKDWFSLDLKGGSGYIKQHPLDKAEVDYAASFAGGYGFRLRLYNQDNKKIILGFQHISVHPKSTNYDGKKNQAILDDWQGSLLFASDFKKITPYLGLKYSRMDYIHKKDGNRKRKMSDLTKTLGLVLGIDLGIEKNTWINLETQFLDTKALAISINYNF